MNSELPGLSHRARVAIRILVRAIHYFVLCVFAAPCAWSMISGSDVRPPIHSWRSWLILGITYLFASSIQEIIQYLLTRNRRIRSDP